MGERGFQVAAAVALLAGTVAASAQPVRPCALLSGADVAAVSREAAGPTTADDPVTLAPAQVPGLPVALEIGQCTSPVRASGAVALRIATMTGARAMTPADWDATLRAIDRADGSGDPKPAARPDRCWQHAWTPKPGRPTLHEVGCGAAKGRTHVTVSFEHENSGRLPSREAVSALLDKALRTLP